LHALSVRLAELVQDVVASGVSNTSHRPSNQISGNASAFFAQSVALAADGTLVVMDQSAHIYIYIYAPDS
jgi:hypothetical protein